MRINQAALAARIDEAIARLDEVIELPVHMRAIVPVIKLQLPELLADEAKRQEIIGILQLVGWAIGYTVTYTEDDSILEKTEGGDPE